MAAGSDVKQLLLQVDASVELAKRNLNSLEREVAQSSAKMDRSLGTIDGATARLGKSFDLLKGAAAGFLGAITVGAIVNAGRNILKFADDLATAADQAGISVERYQTLTEAFRTLELSTDQVDKVLKTLQATLGDVQSGADNSATKALNRLGISAKVMSGEIATSDQLLDALAASAKTAGSQAQFTSDLVDVFGKKVGVDLAAALKDGGAALSELEQGMIDAGLVISKDLIDKLADANEALDKFAANTKVQMTLLAGELIEIFGSLDNAWETVTGNWTASIDAFGERTFFSISRISDDVNRIISNTLREADTLINIPRRVSAYVDRQFDRITPDFLYRPDKPTPLSRMQRDFDVRTGMDRVLGGDPFRDLPPARGPALRPPAVKPPKGAKKGGAKKGGAKKGPKAKPEITMADLRERANAAAFDEDAIYSGTFRPGGGILDAAAIDRVRDSLQQVQSILGSMPIPDVGSILPIEDQQRLEQFASGFKNDLAAGLADAIVYGENLGDVLENTFKRAAAAMIQSGILNFLSGGREGTSFGTFFANIGSLFGGKREMGGPVSAGKAYLVGEKRPELFVPGVSGSIIPRVGGGGGNPISLTVNAPGATAETVMMIRRELANAAPMLVSASMNATMRSATRTRL